MDDLAGFTADGRHIDATGLRRSPSTRLIQNGLLRLPGHFPHIERRPVVGRDRPDLSTQDPSKIVSSGGVVGDNLGQFYGEVVFAIAPSPIQKGLIWAGTNDGKIWYTNDAGKSWNDLSKNVSGMPPWGTITKIEPSHFDPAVAHVVVDYHIMDNRDLFIYKTADFGRTWTKISDGLPQGHPLSYAISLAENPNRKGMLFAGTGNGFFYSLDDGALDEISGRAARRARHLDRRAERSSRCRRVDVRAGSLRHGGHHDARAERSRRDDR